MTWLVTGCSSGFGEQFINGILARGDRVIATGQQATSRLVHLKDTGANILDLDVTVSETELDEEVAEALAIYGSIHIQNELTMRPSGAVECLQKELSMFGISTIIFEPGCHRTKAFGNILHQTPASIPDHSGFNKAVRLFETTSNGKEPGDPKKAVERMIDVVKGDGLAKGKDLPVRMPLGSDGLQIVQDKCLATWKLCEEWEGLITSTDIK